MCWRNYFNNFSEKLFQLIQDIRILREHYNKINRELMSVNNEGKKILKDAISLKQKIIFIIY